MQADQLNPICDSVANISGAKAKCTRQLNNVIQECNACLIKMDISIKQLESATEITDDVTNTYQAALNTCQQKRKDNSIIELLGKELKNCDEVYNELTTVQELVDYQMLKKDEDGEVPFLSDEAEALKQHLEHITEY